jgi:hypothetical protein
VAFPSAVLPSEMATLATPEPFGPSSQVPVTVSVAPCVALIAAPSVGEVKAEVGGVVSAAEPLEPELPLVLTEVELLPLEPLLLLLEVELEPLPLEPLVLPLAVEPVEVEVELELLPEAVLPELVEPLDELLPVVLDDVLVLPFPALVPAEVLLDEPGETVLPPQPEPKASEPSRLDARKMRRSADMRFSNR